MTGQRASPAADGPTGTGAREPGGLLSTWEGRDTPWWADRLSVAAAEFHSRIGSTNDRARELAGAGGALPAIVVADRQWGGRGRRGRRWESDTPKGLWFTIARHGWAAGTETLPLRAGLAVARALEADAPDLRIQVKWPNDLVVRHRKLGGILCERASGAMLVGIGLNLDHTEEELPGVVPPATSLRIETGLRLARGAVLAGVADALERVWERPGSTIPSSELEALEARSPLVGRPLSVSGVVRDSREGVRAVESLAAVGSSLLPDGSLEVRDDSGERWRVIAGTVESWS